MIKRTIEIANPAYLSTKSKQLVIQQDKEIKATIPIEDLGFLILAHPAITLSLRALAAMQENSVAVVCCNEKYLPTATFTPLAGHSLHARILREQIEASLPIQKRLWQQIVRAKVLAQARLLTEIGQKDERLYALAKQVKSGDSGNLEAIAAVRYWPRLLGASFKRDPEGEGLNILLNYGYSILRSVAARAVSGTGLHPALGLFHRNQYNAYALADDIMEPLRPMVDKIVYHQNNKHPIHLNTTTRKHFLQLPAESVIFKKRTMPLMTAMGQFAASVRDTLRGKRKQCEVPMP